MNTIEKVNLFKKILNNINSKTGLLSTREALLVATTFEETLKQLQYTKNNQRRSKKRMQKSKLNKKKVSDRLEKIL